MTAPTNGSNAVGNVIISATASDNVGVTKVEFLVDNNVVNTDTGSPYTYAWDSKSVANGSHNITAKAYDAANNSVSSTQVAVTVNNQVAAITAPMVSFTFDDGNRTVFDTYYPILKAAGYRGTVYINTDEQEAGLDWKLSVEQLNILKNDGWEIANHVSTHSIASLSYAEYEAALVRGKTWLTTHGFSGKGFANPDGRYDGTIDAIVRKHHIYSRNNFYINPYPVTEPYSLGANLMTDPPNTIVNTIKADKSWIIFLNHGWLDTSYDSAATFQQYVNSLKSNNIPSYTVEEVISGTVTSPPPPPPSNCTNSRGDVNNDGRINISDAAMIMAKWGQNLVNDPADLNCDGRVNISDAAVMMANWG